jgi:hypothetical protein
MSGLLADADDIDDDIGRLPKKGKRGRGAYRDRHRRPASESTATFATSEHDDDVSEQSHAFIADVALDGGRVDHRRAPQASDELAASISVSSDILDKSVANSGPSTRAVTQSDNDDGGTSVPVVATAVQVVPDVEAHLGVDVREDAAAGGGGDRTV